MSRSPRGRDYTPSRSPSPRQDENRPRSMSIERPPRRQARSPTRPAHSKDTRVSLYVSGLGPKVTEDDLYEHFAKEGKVLRYTRVQAHCSPTQVAEPNEGFIALCLSVGVRVVSYHRHHASTAACDHACAQPANFDYQSRRGL